MSKPARESCPALVMEVRGDFACFTRPELKAERVSYPVMTPSAARGVLQAIFWKPEFDYRIEQIDVLNEIKWFSIRRNEVTDAPSLSTVLKEGRRYHFRAPDKRDQRNTVALRDVAYRIHAQIELKPHATAHVAKYRDQFHHRIERGASFTHPTWAPVSSPAPTSAHPTTAISPSSAVKTWASCCCASTTTPRLRARCGSPPNCTRAS
ncbi:type I-C CRISPR-associated protein Cas5c [Nonomuraea angiospora]|uniref:type I-C CRISPR-associated protein Cas5c n=1 Tax=Nonomuraea angiospora TaxID=46172 RepID=UPI0034369413